MSQYNHSYNQAKSVYRKETQLAEEMKIYDECVRTKNIDDKENIISGKIINEDLDGALRDARKLMENISNVSKDLRLNEIKVSIFQVIIKNNKDKK